MNTLTIEVQTRIVGTPRVQPALESVLLGLLGGRITAAELIRRTVEEQIRNLTVRLRLDAEQVREALGHHYPNGLGQEPRIIGRAPQAESHLWQVELEAEVERAWRSFEKGAFMILVGRRRLERLDEEVAFDLDRKVTFLRLTPLVGG